MTQQLIRVVGAFAVARPIPWDEGDTLRDHIDRVIDTLTEAEGVVEIDAESELDRGEVRLAIVLVAAGEEVADRQGRETIAIAIRQCEGRHFQLLTEAEETDLTQSVPARSGLLTPLWRLRTLSVEPLPAGAT